MNSVFSVGYVEEIELYDPEYFGDGQEHPVSLRIFDGMAVEDCGPADNPIVVLYPKVEEVRANKELFRQVKACRAQGVVTKEDLCPEDILVALGQVTDYLTRYGIQNSLSL